MLKKLGNLFKKKEGDSRDEPAPAVAAAAPARAAQPKQPAKASSQLAAPSQARPEISTTSRSVSSGMRPPTEAPSIVRGVQGMTLASESKSADRGAKPTTASADGVWLRVANSSAGA
jgi:hypothetical protein